MCYGYIYLIEDTTNGMKYVGQHKNNNYFLDEDYHGSGTIIKKIINKRQKTLVESIICGVDSIDEANFFEKYWIEKYNTIYPNGYNLTNGGNSTEICEKSRKKMSESHKGKKLSEEHRKKLSEKLKGRFVSEEHRKKISESEKGKTHTEETKKKISETQKGRKLSEETKTKIREKNINNCKTSKKIIQFTKYGVFVAEYQSINEVERQTKIKHENICKVLKGERKSAGGYKWKYKTKTFEKWRIQSILVT